MVEAFQTATLLCGGILLLSQGLLYLGLLCLMIGLYSTKLHTLVQIAIAGSLLFALVL